MRNVLKIVIALSVSLAAATTMAAEEKNRSERTAVVELKQGKPLSGRIVDFRNGDLVLKKEDGDRTIDLDKIKLIRFKTRESSSTAEHSSWHETEGSDRQKVLTVDPEAITVNADSIEKVLSSDGSGWASKRVFTPNVARVGDRLRLFFGGKAGDPGLEGIGYLNLNEHGLPLNTEKVKLKVKNGYKWVAEPEFSSLRSLPGIEDQSFTAAGSLYATNYYIWRANQWARYITRAELTRADDKLTYGAQEKVVTGTGNRGHWMARSVAMPELVGNGSSLKLFFAAKTWPRKSNDRVHTLAYLEKQENGWSEPYRLKHPETEDGIWPYKIKGYEDVPLGQKKFLFFVLFASPSKESDPDGKLKMMVYEKSKIRWEKDLLVPEQLIGRIEKASSAQSLQGGLDISRIREKYYIYFPIYFEGGTQALYRMRINLPQGVKARIR